MDFITLSDTPCSINNIRERLANQISLVPSPSVDSATEVVNDDETKTAEDSQFSKEDEPQLQSIDEAVDIDPSFVLEDETSRNTRLNSMLYDQETDSSSINLDHTDEEGNLAYRLMESNSTLSFENKNVVQGPIPVHPSKLVGSPFQLTPNHTPIMSPSGTPIRSSIKSPLSSNKNWMLKHNSNYEKLILFDTLSNKNANNLQLILRTQHKDYKYSRISRTFLCGYDEHQYSETALKWVIDEMIDDGDMLVCLKVIDKENLNVKLDYQLENEKIMEKILNFNKLNKKISILLEICVSTKVSKKIMQAISDYEPSLLVVGTSGVSHKGFKNIISPKSMSKYCLQYSDIPVVVVKPTYKPQIRKRSCITVKKIPKISMEQSLDELVLGDKDEHDDDDNKEEEEEYEKLVKVDEEFYKKLLFGFIPSDLVPIRQKEERLTRASRPKSSIFPRLLTPQRSHDLTPTTSGSSELLAPIRSRGFSPVRSLSPFWRKNKS